MDRAQHVLEDRAARLSTTKVFFEDLSATLKRYEYQPTPEDSQAIQDCVSETKRLPKVELAVGALGGFLLGSVIKQRTGATLLGMFLCYKIRDRQPAADHCLQRMMTLPTPMGAEMIEIVKSRDAHHPLLSQLPDRSDLPGRIATTAAETERRHQVSGALQDAPAQDTSPGDGLWDLSDPFDLCFQQPADVSTPGPASKIAKKSKSQQRKEQRQALYKERREARRQHQEGQLSDNW